MMKRIKALAVLVFSGFLLLAEGLKAQENSGIPFDSEVLSTLVKSENGAGEGLTPNESAITEPDERISNFKFIPEPNFRKSSNHDLVETKGSNSMILLNPACAAPKIPDLPADELMRKGKNKTLIGGIFAGAGAVGVATGIAAIVDGNKKTKEGDFGEAIAGGLGVGVGIALVTGGAILGGVSIPFFTRGSKLKQAARLKMGSVSTPQNLISGQSVTNPNYIGIGWDLSL